MDEQRALLDSLMGLNRDGDRPQLVVTDFRHENVCKHFLGGLCMNDLFINTKMDYGPCPKLHPEDLKLKYVEERKTRDFGYEAELYRVLERTISDVEKKIARAQKRLEDDEGSSAPVVSVENDPEVLRLTAEIHDTMARAEKAGEDGEVDESMALMTRVEELKAAKSTAQAAVFSKIAASAPAVATTATGAAAAALVASGTQKLRVCDVCGAFLSIFDSDRRLADHFGGKLHLGYVLIREKLPVLKASLDASTISSLSTASSTMGRERERDRERERERDWEREKPRERDDHYRRNERERDFRDRDRDRDPREGGRDYRDGGRDYRDSGRGGREHRDGGRDYRDGGRDSSYRERDSRRRSRSRSRDRRY